MADDVRALQAAIAKLPDAVTAALKVEAHASAQRIAAHAAALLRAQTHGTGRTAAAIRVLEEGGDRQFVVNSPGTADKPENLPIWLEYGTRFMTAKPHMRPAADAESAAYKAHMAAAAERAAQKVLA